MSGPIDAFWLPSGCGLQPSVTMSEVGGVTIRWPQLTAADLSVLSNWLVQRQSAVLAQRSVGEIVSVLDEVAARWLEPSYPLRKEAIPAISAVTGFSPEMVAHAIELEQVSSRKDDLMAALDNELGDHRVLDGFVDSPKGQSMAVGPKLVGGIFSANIPALPHLTVMRSFLVKAACLGRVSRGEPVYLPLYARSIAEVDPELASCLGVVYWPSEDMACEQAFFEHINHLIAYGRDDTLNALRRRIPNGLRATWHGHRMGFAYIGRDALQGDVRPLAQKLAYDFTVFDQHACLAPQACFIETGAPTAPEEFAVVLAEELSHWLEKLPPRRLSIEAAAGLRSARDRAELNQALGQSLVMTPPDQLQGTVVVERLEHFLPSPLDRFARVVPIQNASELLDYLAPVGSLLQCAAVAGASSELKRILASLGVTRLCPPGAMGTPSMIWHHDGRPCISDLIRWCDDELFAPG